MAHVRMSTRCVAVKGGHLLAAIRGSQCKQPLADLLAGGRSAGPGVAAEKSGHITCHHPPAFPPHHPPPLSLSPTHSHPPTRPVPLSPIPHHPPSSASLSTSPPMQLPSKSTLFYVSGPPDDDYGETRQRWKKMASDARGCS
jgi:hypothetical protein